MEKQKQILKQLLIVKINKMWIQTKISTKRIIVNVKGEKN